MGHRLNYVGKIVSHQNPDGAADEGERWLFQGNAAADALAESAYAKYPELMRTLDTLKQEISDVSKMRSLIHKVIIAVGLKAVIAANPTQVSRPTDTPLETLEALLYKPGDIDLTKVSKRFSFPNNQQVLDWFLQVLDREAVPVMVSWFQLAILFERQTQLPGLVYKPSSKRYFMASATARPPFNKRANHLSRWLQGVCGSDLKVTHARPQSHVIRFWCMCVTLRVSETLLDQADQYLAEGQPFYGKVSELQRL